MTDPVSQDMRKTIQSRLDQITQEKDITTIFRYHQWIWLRFALTDSEAKAVTALTALKTA